MLAQGYYGKVYACNSPGYVVKQILRTRLCDAEVEAMVFVQRASPRHHVGLVDYYCDSTHAFLIMEKAQTDLIDLIRSRHASRRWFTFQEVLSAGMAMLESIQALHDNNILHRDIKPDNVLIFDVQDLRTLRMADFGMAHFLRECSVSYEDSMGTPEYSAPEVQSIPSPGHGRPSDMWSFGATLHVLLTGRNAFGSRTDSDVAKRVRTGDRLDIRKALKAQEFEPFIPLVDWCLHPQPDLRPTAAQALQMLGSVSL